MAWIETYGHGGDLLTAGKLFNTPPGDFLDFSANINPLGPPTGMMQVLQNNLASIIHYPDPAKRILKNKLAEKHAVTPEHILIGNGAAECMALAILGLKPETVGVVYPCFSEYEQLARTFGANIQSCYGKWEYNYKPNMSDLLQLLSKSDLVFIGHPNNPTGVLYTKEELIQIATYAQQSHTYVIVDEAFIDFLPFDNQVSLLPEMEAFQNMIFIRSMTKFYAIPGLRLGYAVAHPKLIEKLQEKQVSWSVNQLALAAGEACLEEKEYGARTIDLILEQRGYLKEMIEKHLGWFVFPGQANFLLVRLPQELKAADLQWKLGQKGILIRSCSMYPGLTSHDFRIAVRTRQENDRLLQAMFEAAEEESN